MKDAVQAVMIEVACPRHGRVLAEVSRRTSAAGPPCPECGSACTIYAPMLALARACAEVAPQLGLSRLLQALQQEEREYPATSRRTAPVPRRDESVAAEPLTLQAADPSSE